jgi:hypothetical protein
VAGGFQDSPFSFYMPKKNPEVRKIAQLSFCLREVVKLESQLLQNHCTTFPGKQETVVCHNPYFSLNLQKSSFSSSPPKRATLWLTFCL